jgi:hypothetical protein
LGITTMENAPMPDTAPTDTETAAQAFAALIRALKHEALHGDDESGETFNRRSAFIHKVTDLAGRYAEGRPASGPRAARGEAA